MMASKESVIYLPDNSPQRIKEEVSEFENNNQDLQTQTKELPEAGCNDSILSNNTENNMCFFVTPVGKPNMHICTKCGKCFKKKCNLNSHMITTHMANNTEKPYACTKCDFSTGWSQSLKTHLLKHSDEKELECEVCDYKTHDKSSLKKHKVSHQNERPFLCMKCNDGFKTKRSLDRHMMRWHMADSSENPYACTQCEFTTLWKPSFKSHLLSHSDERPFACDECDYKARRKSHLEQHKWTHQTDRPFLCKDCNNGFKSERALEVHMKTHLTSYLCPECGVILKTQASLKQHIEVTHKREKRRVCKITGCGMSFAYNESLKLHMRDIHSIAIEQKYTCSFCDYKTHIKKCLTMHLRKHTGEKPFSCPHCDYKCAIKPYLRVHLRSHFGDKPFACELCSYRAAVKSNLNQHMKSHTRDD